MRSRWYILCFSLAFFVSLSVACGPECPEGQKKCGERCVNLQNDPSHCGDCDTKCDAGKLCEAGACSVSCQAGLKECGGTCVNTKTDERHCGDCNNACKSGEACTESKCEVGCPEGQTACSGLCVNTKTDLKNCGACGTTCKEGEACKDGACTAECPKGLTSCGSACVNTQANQSHCGACDAKCDDGKVCNAGKCELQCTTGLTDCSGACVNTKLDRQHCGACGNVCKGGEECKNQTCELNCGTGFENCGGVCVNTQASNSHCGKCGTACKTNENCKAGKCVLECPKGLTDCKGVCADVQNDPKNCGACGTVCTSNQVCQGGTCQTVCQKGFTDCNGSCINTQTDSRHCGGCHTPAKPTACPQGDLCEAGKCKATCAGNEQVCSGACTNTNTDVNHCGACGTACKTDEACISGSCTTCTDCPKFVKKVGGYSSDNIYGVAVDGNGNVYAVGHFNSIVDFGKTRLRSVGSSDIFVLKMNAAGRVIWAKRAGGSSIEYGYGVSVDGSGNVYITGGFETSADFGTTKLSAVGSSDIFAAKLNKDGVWQWAKGYGSTSADYGYDIAVDSNGNSYVTGQFYSKVAFGTSSLQSKGSSDPFLLKLDKDGKEVWAKSDGSTSFEQGEGVAVDGSGNVYITGRYYTSMTWGGATTIKSKGSSDAFVAKFDGTGKLSWLAGGGGSSTEYSYDIAVDGSGNVYVTGAFRTSSTDAEFGTTKLQSQGIYDVFVAKLDNTGKWSWAASAGGSGSDYGRGVGVDSKGSVYVTGYFYETANFGSTTLKADGTSPDIFLMQLNASGKPTGALRMGGTSSDYGRALQVSSKDEIYVGGYFGSTVGFGKLSLLTSGSTDGFVAKYARPNGPLCPTSSGYNICSGVCLSLAQDNKNCGACGKVCTGKQICGGGKCRDCTDCPLSFVSGSSTKVGDDGEGWAATSDSAGNIYFAGRFYGGMSFGTTNLKSKGSADIFVVKADKDGKTLWATSFGSTSTDYAHDIAVDSKGQVYVAGRFGTSSSSTMAIGSSTLKSRGGSDIYVAKLTSKGVPIWGASGGSGSYDYGYGLKVDNSENVYIAGYTYTTATFGTLKTTSKGSADIFVGKLNKAGTWTLAKNFGGTSSDYARGLSLDSSGNIYIGGYFNSSGGAVFDSFTLKPGSTPDLWVAKLNNSGVVQWAVAGGGAGSQYGYHVTSDNSGNAYITGYMTSGGGTFGTIKLTTNGGNDAIVLKVDKNGKWAWGTNFGGTSSDYGYGVGVNSSGHIYVGGYTLSSSLNVGPFNLTGKGSADAFLVKFDTNGKVIGAARGGGTASDYANRMYVDATGNAYIAGESYSNEMFFSISSYKRATKSTPMPYLVKFGPTPCPITGNYGVCSGACVDLNTDKSHCGACAKACSTGQSCKAGTCQ